MGVPRHSAIGTAKRLGLLAADGSEDHRLRQHGFCKACQTSDVDLIVTKAREINHNHLHLGALCVGITQCVECRAEFHTNTRDRDGAGGWRDGNDPTIRRRDNG